MSKNRFRTVVVQFGCDFETTKTVYSEGDLAEMRRGLVDFWSRTIAFHEGVQRAAGRLGLTVTPNQLGADLLTIRVGADEGIERMIIFAIEPIKP
jgi:hypothetical protein